MNYLITWAHAYAVHFGFWVTFVVAMTIYDKGAPEIKELPGLFKTAVVISLILSIFSSHSHVHYLDSFVK